MFFDPPFIFNFCIWSVSIISLSIIFRKTVTPYWMKYWWIVVIFFLLAGLDNHLLQASRPERWFMLVLTVAGSLITIYAFLAGHWKEMKERGLDLFCHIRIACRNRVHLSQPVRTLQCFQVDDDYRLYRDNHRDIIFMDSAADQ